MNLKIRLSYEDLNNKIIKKTPLSFKDQIMKSFHPVFKIILLLRKTRKNDEKTEFVNPDNPVGCFRFLFCNKKCIDREYP